MTDDLTFQCPMCNAHLAEESRGHVDPTLCGICEDPANREESEHTPGPWWYAATTLDGATHDGYAAGAGDHEMTLALSEADARLIAAAPDLLDACKIAYGCTAGAEVATARRILLEAIRKATEVRS